jgi:hypothetical protein
MGPASVYYIILLFVSFFFGSRYTSHLLFRSVDDHLLFRSVDQYSLAGLSLNTGSACICHAVLNLRGWSCVV